MKRNPSPQYLAARELAKRVTKMTDAEKDQFVASFPAVMTIEGRTISAHNTIMALTQAPKATIVGGFKQWQGAGRLVRQGQKALWIFAPSVKKGDNGDESVFFRLVPVFDISQTEDMSDAAERAGVERMLEDNGII